MHFLKFTSLIFFIVANTHVAYGTDKLKEEKAPSSTAPLVSNFTDFASVSGAGLTAWVNKNYAPYSPLLIAFGETTKNFWDMVGIFKGCCSSREPFSHFTYPPLIANQLENMNGISVWVIRELLEWIHQYDNETGIDQEIDDSIVKVKSGGITLTIQPAALKKKDIILDSSSIETSKEDKFQIVKLEGGKKEKGINKKTVAALASESFFSKLLPKENVRIIMAALGNGSIKAHYEEETKKHTFTFKSVDKTTNLFDFIVEGTDDGMLAKVSSPPTHSDYVRKGILGLLYTANAWGWSIPIAVNHEWLPYCAIGYFIGKSVIGTGASLVDKVISWRKANQDLPGEFFQSLLETIPYVKGNSAEIFLEFYETLQRATQEGVVKMTTRTRTLVDFEVKKNTLVHLKGAHFKLSVTPPLEEESSILIEDQGKIQGIHKKMLKEAFQTGRFEVGFFKKFESCLTGGDMGIALSQTGCGYTFKSQVPSDIKDPLYQKGSEVLRVEIILKKPLASLTEKDSLIEELF